MKVLQINAVYGVGSTGYLVEEIHTYLKKQGVESYVMWGTKCRNAMGDKNIIQIGNWFDHKLHALLYRVFFDQGWHSYVATYFACRKIKKLKIDVIHLHNLHGNYINLPYFLKFCARNDIAIVPILHDCWFFTGQCFHFYANDNCQQWKTGCYDCPLARNNFQKKRVQKLFKEKKQLFTDVKNCCITGGTEWIVDCGKESLLASAGPIVRINDWVDISKYQRKQARADICRKLGIPEDKKVVLGVAQEWTLEKGIDAQLALSEALDESAVLVLVGGYDKTNTNSKIKYIGYTENRQELVDLYYAADLVVNSSRMETFGLVTVEAMACGTPVVAYSNTGTSELITSECGWLVEDGNIESMISTVRIALNSKLEEKSESCKAWVLQNFDQISQLSKYLDLYYELAENRIKKSHH